MELAAQHPTRVASLVLLEPAFFTTSAGAAFARAVAPLTDRYQAEGAVHGFLALVGDRNWREATEQTVPGRDRAGREGRRDLLRERADRPDMDLRAGAGRGHHLLRPFRPRQQQQPLFVEGRQLLHAWFPACRDANIVGATHLLQMQAPGPVAAAIAAFL